VSELQDMLRVQARLHRKQGANAIGQLFESALEEIQILNKNYNQLFDAFQNCHDELVDANERVKELENAILDVCSAYYFEPDLSQPVSSLNELLIINSKWTLDPEISSDSAKFAIDKKIEALEFILGRVEPVTVSHVVKYHIVYCIEQLRKEKDSE
tara:strand:+ start:3251 stop:3718 length:468 start_codon:yes stop_codon:yes gene_type:complete